MIERLKGYKLKPGDVVYDINPHTNCATKFRVHKVDIIADDLELIHLEGTASYLKNQNGFVYFSTKGIWYKQTILQPVKHVKEFKL